MSEQQKTPADAYSDWLEEQEKLAPPLNPNAVDPDEDDADDIDDEDESSSDSEKTTDAEANGAEASSNSPERGKEVNTMSALRKMLLDEAAEDSDAGRRAKKALMAYDEEEPKDGEEEPKPAEATTEGKPPGEPDGDEPPKAEGNPGEKEPDGDEEPKKTASRANLSLAAKVQELTAWKAQQEETTERAKLMASRADLSGEVVSFLASQPISVVRDACRPANKGGLPLGPGKGGATAAARAALKVEPTQPAGTGNSCFESGLSNTSGHGQMIAAQLGLDTAVNPIVLDNCRLSLGAMTPDQARALQVRLAKDNK